MARPRKSEAERLQPVMTAVRPDTARRLERLADAREVSVSQLLRQWLERRLPPGFDNKKQTSTHTLLR